MKEKSPDSSYQTIQEVLQDTFPQKDIAFDGNSQEDLIKYLSSHFAEPKVEPITDGKEQLLFPYEGHEISLLKEEGQILPDWISVVNMKVLGSDCENPRTLARGRHADAGIASWNIFWYMLNPFFVMQKMADLRQSVSDAIDAFIDQKKDKVCTECHAPCRCKVYYEKDVIIRNQVVIMDWIIKGVLPYSFAYVFKVRRPYVIKCE